MEQNSTPAQTTNDASRRTRSRRILAIAFSIVVLIALLLVLRGMYFGRAPQSPVVGIWRQSQEKPCTSAWIQEERVHELIFAADGRFSVTYKAFCDYKDYWGRYTYDRANGRITMQIDGGSTVPDDFDGEGMAMYEAGTRETIDALTLEGVWLGKGNSERTEKACQIVFGRISSGDIEAP
jgi:hypothetical protein